MANRRAPTVESLTAEVAALRASLDALTQGLSRAQFNWQPDGGARWSIAECIDHMARGNAVYLDAIDAAIAAAPARAAAGSFTAKPNTLGRWFAQSLEPPVRTRLHAPKLIHPKSDLDLVETVHRFDATLVRLVATMPRAWAVDLNRTKFRNPLLRGLRVFNVAAAFQILTSHCRRHMRQAEGVRARSDWPKT